MKNFDKIFFKHPKILAQLFRPVCLLDRQSSIIEKIINIKLDQQDLICIRKACSMSGVRLGEYYHWYLQKKLVSDSVRNLNSSDGIRLILSIDGTDYSPVENNFDTNNGIIIAIPHHAHYIFSVVAIVEKLRKTRKVLILFGEPGRNPGNEVFDRMSTMFYGDDNGVDTVHDNRQGLARIIRALKDGAAVLILPDAFHKEEDTIGIPFCGGVLNIMLGTAILARKTASLILPILSVPNGNGFGFRTIFSTMLSHNHISGEDPVETKLRDYSVMRKIFDFYENYMLKNIIYWQQVRRHLSQNGDFNYLSEFELKEIAAMLVKDPALTGPHMTVDLISKT